MSTGDGRRSVVLEPGGVVLATKVRRAHTSRERARGLLGAPEPSPGECLWLEGCGGLLVGNAIHTFGMRYPIDVMFCARDGSIRHVVRNLQPGRVSRFVARAHHVIEFPAGTLKDDLRPGDKVALLPPV